MNAPSGATCLTDSIFKAILPIRFMMSTSVRRTFTALLASFFLSTLADPASAAPDACKGLLEGLFKSRNQRTAEEIMQQYEPFQSEGFALRPVFESRFNGVYLGIHAKRPTAPPFIAKISPLEDAVNDYVALRAIRKAQEKCSVRVKIIKGTILTPKTGEIGLTTPVLQVNEFVEGRPLIEVLADPDVDLLRKTILKSRFRAWVDEMKAGLNEAGYNAFRHEAEEHFFQKHSKLIQNNYELLPTMPGILMAEKPWLSTVSSASSFNRHLTRITQGKVLELAGTFEDINIILKPDNIFVNEADEFALIDPF
jgi:hypothetical protein